MENVSSSNGLEKRPKLRFPGFNEPWQSTLLSSVFAKNTKKNTDGQITNVICNSAKQGLIPQREYFDKDIANIENTSGYYIIEENDFVYNPRKSTDAPYGPISSYKYTEAGIVSPLYLCFRAKKEINPTFFEWYFRSSAWHRYVYMSGDSGARHDRVSIKDDTFFAMPINLPSAHEQEHIASFLERIDQRIEMQRALVENLKKYKRGLLRATFSQEVHLSNSATWERRKFREIASLRRAKYTPSHADSRACVELEHIEQQTGRLINYVDSAEQNSIKSVFKQGDVLFGKLRPYLRKYCLPQFDGVCSSEIWVLVPETCVVSEYLFYLVQSDEFLAAANISSGTKMPRAEWSKVSNEDYFIPLISEQKRIARMLSIVDRRITTASEMLSTLERMRKSFLQQIFI